MFIAFLSVKVVEKAVPELTHLLQAHVETGEYVHTIPTTAPAPCVVWHPSRYWLAYTGDAGGLKIVGAAGGSL